VRTVVAFGLRMLLLYVPGRALMAYYSLVGRHLGRRHAAWLRHAIPRWLTSTFLRWNGVELEVEGFEHFAAFEDGPRVMVANHNSRFDGYILLALCPFAFKSFWSTEAHVTSERYHVIRRFGELFDLFFVHDKKNLLRTRDQFRIAEDFVAGGGALSFFPEGRYSRDGRVAGMGSACFGLALRTRAVILPIVLLGTQHTFEKRPRRGAGPVVVRVRVLPPLRTDDAGPQNVTALTRQVEATMNRVIDASS
jgi:1-acyl-sn-glycerol-3-phosphate acyltransferase